MIVVTGGAGFIGSNLIQGLNDSGEESILVVDNLRNPDKAANLSDCRFADYIDKDDFRTRLGRNESFGEIETVFHQGACSDTMVSDGRYVMDNNYQYSKELLEYCLGRGIAFIYASSASVYGGGNRFIETRDCEKPLNAYALSKWLFDRYVCSRNPDSQVVGLRYFNVYGPPERHKGRMASVVWHSYEQYLGTGCIRLFEGTGGFGDGEQRRDFVWVGDVIKVNLHFMRSPGTSGVFNVGTGAASSFNDVARAVIRYTGNGAVFANASVSELVARGRIKYIPLPDALVGKYQSFTEADLSSLRRAGYAGDFTTIDEGVEAYVRGAGGRVVS